MSTLSFVRIFSLALAFSFMQPVFAADDASMHEVYVAAEAGQFNQAQAMMDKVLKDHPNSAKAHYVEAELLAKQGQFAAAKVELDTAQRLQPNLSFAKPQALQKLMTQIDSSHTVSTNNPTQSNNQMPWGMIFLMVGLVGFIYMVAKMMARNNPSPSTTYAGATNANPQTYAAPPAPMMAPSAGMGSGIMGGLATGAALGVGLVAGEALMHHFTDGSASNGLINAAQANNAPDNYNDMGGTDFGVADSSSWDDGSAGDDWS
jgi:tetratricopeptide (TPR) repeat protein